MITTILGIAISLNLIDIRWDPSGLTSGQRSWCETFARDAVTMTKTEEQRAHAIELMQRSAISARSADLPRVAAYLDRVVALANGGDAIAAEEALKAEAHGPVMVLVRTEKRDASPFTDIIIGIRDPDDEWLLAFQGDLEKFEKTLPGFSASWNKSDAAHGVSFVGNIVAHAGVFAQSTAPASYPPFDTELRAAVGRSWIHWKNMNIANWFDREVQPAAATALEPASARNANGEALARWYALRYVTTGIGNKLLHGRPLQSLLGDAWAPVTIVKSDVTAVLASQWLKRESLDVDLATFAGVTFHTLNDVIHGDAPPQHRPATAIVLNWCLRHGGLTATDSGWRITPRAMEASLRSLVREVLEIETSGDRARADRLIAGYGNVTPAIQKVIDRLPSPAPPKATVRYAILDPLRIQRLSWAGIRIEAPQSTLFIDPVSSKEIWDGKREVVPLIASAKRRAVLITHLHNDHFDAPAIKQLLAAGGAVFCLDTMAAVVASKGVVARPVEMFHPEAFGDFVFIPVPAADGFGDVQVSWIVKAAGMNIIHCGDTIWHSGFERLGRAYGPFDFAFMPINGVVVSGRPIDVDVPATMTPSQAVAAASLLRAKLLVPVHYGAPDEGYREVADPAGEVARAAAAKGVAVKIVSEGDWVIP